MTPQTGYGLPAKILHWVTVALIVIQFLVGWLMPDIKRGMTPGFQMNLHMSFGACLLAVMLVRYAWRLAHPVLPDAGLPGWQRLSSEAVHHLLYLFVVITTLTGWVFASVRGWTIVVFGVVPLPALCQQDSVIGRSIGRLHETLTWVVLVLVGIHVAAALYHAYVLRDNVMRRMLPGSPS